MTTPIAERVAERPTAGPPPRLHPGDLLPDLAPLRVRGSGAVRDPGFLVHYEGESAAVAITR